MLPCRPVIAWDRVELHLERLHALTAEIAGLARGFGEVESLRREGLREEAHRKAAYLEARLAKSRTDLEQLLAALLRSLDLPNPTRAKPRLR